MKSLIRYIALYTLVCCVLISTTGTTLYRHFCNMSLQTDLSVFEAKSCCGAEEEEMPAEDNGCCHSSAEFKKTELSTLVDFFKAKLQSYTPFLQSVFIRPSYKRSYYAEQTPRTFFNDTSPPPLSGREIITYKQSFRL